MTLSQVKKNSLVRKWSKQNGADGFTSFDFKNRDIVLYDAGLVSIKKKVKIQRKRRKALFGEDMRVDTLACTIWFDSLDETLDFLIKARDFLNKLGYKTSGTRNENEANIYK